jgi:hypothetical protein
MTRILFTIMLALFAAPVALADGVMPNAVQNGDGVLALDGKTRYVAVGAYGTPTTVLAHISAQTGSVVYSVPLTGTWGLPSVFGGYATGLSADGNTLVLANVPSGYPRTRSGFLIVEPHSLRIRHGVTLPGDFSFDALSPDGSRLYLIQHTKPLDQTHYVVRAYDVANLRLLPGRIADRTQNSWVMQGYPTSRVTSADGRWVYTLYANPGGFPFVHALDTVRGVAHCTGLPWHGKETAVYDMRLTLHNHALAVHWMSGKPWLRMDTRTWRLSPDHRGGFPWWALLFVGLLPVAALALRRDRAARAHKVFRVATRPG